MRRPQQPNPEAVRAQLNQQVTGIRKRYGAPGLWDFQLANGKLHPGRACLEEAMLTLEIPLAAGDLERSGIGPQACWRTLLLQGDPEFPAKFVPDWSAGAGCLRREISLRDQWDWSDQIAGALADLTFSLERLSGGAVPTNPTARNEAAGEEREERVAAISEALTEAGWPHRVEEESRITTQLETRRLHFRRLCRYPARIAPAGTTEIVAWSPILEGVPLDPDQCEAIGAMLLEAGRRLRLVRGAGYQEDGLATVAVQARCRAEATARELDGLLAGLTVACRECGPEIESLSEGRSAGRYLRSFGDVHPVERKEVAQAAQAGN